MLLLCGVDCAMECKKKTFLDELSLCLCIRSFIWIPATFNRCPTTSSIIGWNKYIWTTIKVRTIKHNNVLSCTLTCFSCCPESFILRPTVGQINQEPECKYWATSLCVRSFTRTAHTFTCSAQHALLTRSTALTQLAEFVGKLAILSVFFFYFQP